MTYTVQRPFTGGGRTLQAGEEITDDGWPTGRAARLVAQRYLMPSGVSANAPLPSLGTRQTRAGDGRKRGHA
jgi:hypothetical protein